VVATAACTDVTVYTGEGSGGATAASTSTATGAQGGTGGETSSSSYASDASSAAGGTGGWSSTDGSGAGPGCIDEGREPNEDESSAIYLGRINDCDGAGSQLKGTITQWSDVDWYSYSGTDKFGCIVDPSRAFVATAPLRMCKYAECLRGTPVFLCPGNSPPEFSPSGRLGCCSDQTFSLELVCAGADNDDAATIYIRIDNPDESECVSYTLAYHY
jgi:hypothetical protein